MAGGDGGAVCHGLEFGEDDIRIDRRLADPGAVAAIAASDHVFSADKFGITPDTLRNQLGVLDEIRFRFDDPRNQHLAVGQFHRLKQCPLVGVSWIGGFERDRYRLGLENDVDDVGERDIAMMWAFVVPPAEMHAQLLNRDIGHRMIERLDMQLRALAELGTLRSAY